MTACVVCLHGFTHTGASWQPVIRSLDRRYRVLAPDIRGHGTASRRRPITMESVIADVANLAPPSFDLCGYSMGGRLALHIALTVGQRAKRLVLIGASPGIADPDDRAARRKDDEQLAQRIERSTIDRIAREWAQNRLLTGLPTPAAAAVHADRLRNTPEGLACALRGLGTGQLPSLWERLGEVNVPVTLIAGERDHKFRQIATDMARLILKAQVAIVPGSGHAVHIEAPDAVATIISAGRS
jgi:2-succinyl-6-hydroxy-2,4-cyclohexadiene-1-carboxylate synthase